MPNEPESQEYVNKLNRRLDQLKDIFSAGSIGDFSNDVPEIPVDDEFYEMFMGVQLMIDAIREQEEELEQKVASRTEHLEQKENQLRVVIGQLSKRTKELETINRLMIGREQKMIELKRQIAVLQHKLDQLEPKLNNDLP